MDTVEGVTACGEAEKGRSTMKKLLVAILIAAMLAGCEHQHNIEDGERWMEVVDNGMGLRFQYIVLRHRQTGVCYIVLPHSSATPLLTADGKPYILEGINDDS